MTRRKAALLTPRMRRTMGKIRRLTRLLGRPWPPARGEEKMMSVRLQEYRERQELQRMERAEAVLRTARDFAEAPEVREILPYVSAIAIPPPHGCEGWVILDLSSGSLWFKGPGGDGPSPEVPMPSAVELCFIMRLTWGLGNLEMEFRSRRLWELIGEALEFKAECMKRTLDRRRRRTIGKDGAAVMGGIVAPRGKVIVLR